ncbi:acyltransferase [Nubsella zeaxanthinifaciens]|uniref:acyltransferase n=1 Tax=Nubsella zeaxanthinifaciens TaxID=392412 RepID=UPI000DE1E931|nr:acyltransferase [Nubsella zeaxanthinifaciens]
MIKQNIQHFLGKILFYMGEKCIKPLILNYRNTVLKRQLKGVGENFFVESDHKILNPHYISIGNNFYAWNQCRIEAIDSYYKEKYQPTIMIGENVSIGPYFHLGCINQIIIGNNVLIGSKVFITDHTHGKVDKLKDLDLPPEKRKLASKGSVIIGESTWIGDAVCILSGVKIGKNVIIGANSVVTRDVPDNAIIGGVPARLIRIIDGK